MNANLRQRPDAEPDTLMGTVCDGLCLVAAFALLFGMAFLALHVGP